MNDKMKASHDLLSVVHTFLKDQKEKVTTSDIIRKIDQLVIIKPEWQELADRSWIVEELIRRFQIWTTKETALCDEKGHEKWLVPSLKQDWRFWHRYRTWQERKLPESAMDALDQSTDRILSMLENPKRNGRWDRRGLVVGHVQSGKTANYTGLICKAADAGYKIIIVLAGLHNNLRAQTQMRLDEGFLGYETNPDEEKQKVIGVGEIDSTLSPNFVTTRLEKGDFNARVARCIGITPEERPWLFVVKKNKSVLTSLLKWLHNHVADFTDSDTGEKLVTKLPLLVIDDEADNASVDTGEQEFTADGEPDREHEPKVINQLIRRILKVFTRKAYVGYTATPFANIFIHEQGATKKEGPDLFPSAFIVNLGAPSNYIGPSKLFGRTGVDIREEGLPLIREIADHCTDDGKSGWMPIGHKSGHYPSEPLPASLLEAIDSFFLACAIRKLRGQDHLHSSMLVHVTRYNAVQQKVRSQVTSIVEAMRQRLIRKIDHTSVLCRLRVLWERDFIPVRHAVEAGGHDTLPSAGEEWTDIEKALFEVAHEIEIREINGHAKEALDYADSPTGLKVIAIGGDKLARGLTLEGLCTSYFLRASRMYDTLMQMGRWFGYRPGYLDVCRLYTTPDLVEWFEHIADAAEELREEFDFMADSGGTPRDYGLKVKSHPVLMVTSAIKMRKARNLYLSFSGNTQETVTFTESPDVIRMNRRAFDTLVNSIGKPNSIPEKILAGKKVGWNGIYWDSVDWTHVTDFLDSYLTNPYAKKANSKMLAEYISRMAGAGELTNWTIAVMSGEAKTPDGDPIEESIGGMKVTCVTRKGEIVNSNRFSIGRLLSPRDEAIDLDETTWLLALEKTRQHHIHKKLSEPEYPSGKFIREAKANRPERGLLLFYLIARKSTDQEPLVGFGISFPGSKSDIRVEYKVNNVLWEQEYAFDD